MYLTPILPPLSSETRALRATRPYHSRLRHYRNFKYSLTFIPKRSSYFFFTKALSFTLNANSLKQYVSGSSVLDFQNLKVKSLKVWNRCDNLLVYFNSFRRLSYSWTTWRSPNLPLEKALPNYLNLYQSLGLPIILGLYKKFNSANNSFYIPLFDLYWTFTATHKFFINIRDNSNRSYNYISIYSGLFLKFFKNKKPLRKSKLFKTLMVKFLRKVLLLSSIKNVNMVINRSSPMFSELYRVLLTPSIIPYKAPNLKGFYNDSFLNKKKPLFLVKRVIFRRTHSFTTMKTRKCGRIKRKITRRLVRKNMVLD